MRAAANALSKIGGAALGRGLALFSRRESVARESAASA